MDERLISLLADQSGVVSRRQAHEQGLAPHDLARLVRRRELVRLHPGVFLDHTGSATFQQRAWGGVLLYWPGRPHSAPPKDPGQPGPAGSSTSQSVRSADFLHRAASRCTA